MGQTTHTFSYTSENRLRQIQQGMSSVEFAYDGLGRRISRTVSSGMSATTTHFFYDGDRVINEIAGSAPYVDAYRYGVGLIRRNNEWPLFDSQGNTRLVTNANQSVSAAFVYDAFGNVTYSSGSTSLKNKYCGDWGYRDDGDTFASLSASAGLMHVGARYYDPTTGRFTTRDTLLTEHPYVYCDGDPVNAVDPDGQKLLEWITSAISRLAGAAAGLFTGGCLTQARMGKEAIEVSEKYRKKQEKDHNEQISGQKPPSWGGFRGGTSKQNKESVSKFGDPDSDVNRPPRNGPVSTR